MLQESRVVEMSGGDTWSFEFSQSQGQIKEVGPTQAIQEDGSDSEASPLKRTSARPVSSQSSPVFHRRRPRRRFQEESDDILSSPSLLSRKRPRFSSLNISQRPLEESVISDTTSDSQLIELCPTPLTLEDDLNNISSPPTTSSSSMNFEDDDLLLVNKKKGKRRKRHKNNGLAERLDRLLARNRSEMVLRNHLPTQLRSGAAGEKQVLKGRVEHVRVAYERCHVTCSNLHDPVHKFQAIIGCDTTISRGCDLVLQGPWNSFQMDNDSVAVLDPAHVQVLDADAAAKFKEEEHFETIREYHCPVVVLPSEDE